MHYITMSGMQGYMPDDIGVASRIDIACSSLAQMFELGSEDAQKLYTEGFVRLDMPRHGATYCEITECNCDEPWVHQEGYTKDQWIEIYAEEFGLSDDEDE